MQTASIVPQPQQQPGAAPMETTFWNNLLSDVLFPSVLTDSRFVLECPEEETWIPSDQTIHWGKRPNYIYPTLRMQRKDELPNVPRGSRLVAKLWFSEWAWDEDKSTDAATATDGQSKKHRPDPSSTSCFEDEKTMIPFEKSLAIFRHLRISKNIKLKKTETFTITGLGFEIGYHNPFTKTPFKSLDIYLSKPVRIHVVAHKGSVKLMQKHGLLPQTLAFGPSNLAGQGDKRGSSPTPMGHHSDTLSPSGSDSSGEEMNPPSPPVTSDSITGHKRNLSSLSSSSKPSPSQPSPAPSTTTSTVAVAVPQGGNTVPTGPLPTGEIEVHKKMKTTQMNEILDELSNMQQQMDSLKRRVYEFMMNPAPAPAPKVLSRTVRISCSANRIKSNAFIFYAFRTRNLELGTALIKTFHFNINERNSNGYTVLHVAAKHAFPEGVAWCLQHGAQVNAYTNLRCTPLHLAYLRNDKTVRRILKEHKADTEAVNVWGLKPRDYRNSRRPILRQIPEAAHSVEVVIEGYDKPFEIQVWFAARIGWLEVLKIYIEQLGCDVDVKNTNGQSPLMCACEHRQEEIVRYLLQMGADANARDIHDATPLHYAYMSFDQSRSILEMLEQAGADATVKNIFNRTPAWYKNKTLDNHWNPIWNI